MAGDFDVLTDTRPVPLIGDSADAPPPRSHRAGYATGRDHALGRALHWLHRGVALHHGELALISEYVRGLEAMVHGGEP